MSLSIKIYETGNPEKWQLSFHGDDDRTREHVTGSRAVAQAVRTTYYQLAATGTDVIAHVRQKKLEKKAKKLVVKPVFQALRVELPPFIEAQVALGAWTGETPLSYRRALRVHAYGFKLSDGRTLGDVAVDQITGPMLGEALDAIRRAKKSRALQDRILSPLTAFYRTLRKQRGFRGEDPTDDLKDHLIKAQSKRARQKGSYPFFEQSDGPALFRTCREHFPRQLALLGVQVLAGARIGEAFSLQWPDIDFTEGEIHFQRTLCDKTREIKPPKDKEDRWVSLSPVLAELLQAHQETMRLDADLYGWTPEQRQWVFLRENGELPRYPAYLEHFWQKLLKRAGLRYRKSHSCRHTFITWCAEGNEALGIKPVPILTVRDWAGHSTVQETERYFHRANRRTHARGVAGLDAYVSAPAK